MRMTNGFGVLVSREQGSTSVRYGNDGGGEGYGGILIEMVTWSLSHKGNK